MSEFIDILKNINGKTGELDMEFIEKFYSPYGMNILFSRTFDGLEIAEKLNRSPDMSKWEQYLTYYYGLSKNMRRFGERVDVEKPKYVAMVMDYFDYSRDKARQALTILTKLELQHIKNSLEEGGVQNE